MPPPPIEQVFAQALSSLTTPGFILFPLINPLDPPKNDTPVKKK